MNKSDIYTAIIKIKEYCNKQRTCDECDLCVIDYWDEEECFSKLSERLEHG